MNLPNKLTASRFVLTAAFLAVMFSEVPRYGTCSICTRSFSHSSSIARWLAVAVAFTVYLLSDAPAVLRPKRARA